MNAPVSSTMSRRRGLQSAQVPVIAGFGIMILLLIAGSAIGVSYLHRLSAELAAIVQERNQKSELAITLKSLHDARYLTLRLASEMEDPFERDEQGQRFSQLAGEFIAVRDHFLSLPLSETEIAVWGGVRKELPLVEEEAEQAFDKLRRDQREEARSLIQGPLRQRQAAMMKQWDALIDMQHELNARGVEAAQVAYERARGLVLGLSLVSILVAAGVAGFVIRISRRLEGDLFDERERALVTLNSIGDAVIRFDRDGRIGYLNPVAQSLFNIHDLSSDLSAGMMLRIYLRETRAYLIDTLIESVAAGNRYVLPASSCLLSGQGMELEVEGACTPIHAANGETIGGVLVMRDVTEARELQRKLIWHSDHDTLTGLANRHAFEDHLAQSLGSKRAAQMPMSLLLISLDEIKQVSETAGHAGSDEMLRQLANLIGARVRDADLLASMGYDEFAVILHACPNEMATRIALQIRDSVTNFSFDWNGDSYRVGVHIGVVHLSDQSQDECLDAAYVACHEAGSHGVGSVVVYGQGLLVSAT